ncbi:hypothetical protein QE197_21765 (plasmid) [Arsenophonus nasoniae]|uniref:Uncharacterized protein n=1 Tax=Arsenophonus nasoniae TaxID=638 RepID=A0A4P7L776_9GAMM|nr:hypothetical protein [Arsenophonus nasoniae]QBY46144.1 hypothetical protein ArsFIN_47550 [Arsenophonus nasoniae]WGM08206.1 hypothetical protein QE258_22390 [Arsenophonus nasoniae]WGM13056.1 hypothetical protein QE197_21765 [Arsenophonus nasoniae]WGM17787.1 hypothetical protein QE193_21040 [Arsenophonus nasoniae]
MTLNDKNKSDEKNHEPTLYIINNAEEKDFNDKNSSSTTRTRRDIGIQNITGIFQKKNINL